jgi:hypothetical protein
MDGVIDPQGERILAALKRLQLTHARDTLPAALLEAAKENLTYLQFLDRTWGVRCRPSNDSKFKWRCKSRIPRPCGPSMTSTSHFSRPWTSD